MRLCILILLMLTQSIFICSCESRETISGPKREASEYIEKIFPAIDPFHLEIVSDSGDIEVYSWDREDVKFEITTKIRGTQEVEELEKRLIEFKIDIFQEENKVMLNSKFNGRIERSEEIKHEYKVFVPKKNLERFDLRLDTGKIKFYDDIKCNLNAQMKAANLDINRFEGVIKVNTDRGNLRIAGGKICKGSDIKIITGNILIKAQYEDDAVYCFQTGMGNIELDIPEQSKVCVESIGTTEINEFLYEDFPTRITLISDMGKIYARKF